MRLPTIWIGSLGSLADLGDTPPYLHRQGPFLYKIRGNSGQNAGLCQVCVKHGGGATATQDIVGLVIDRYHILWFGASVTRFPKPCVGRSSRPRGTKSAQKGPKGARIKRFWPLLCASGVARRAGLCQGLCQALTVRRPKVMPVTLTLRTYSLPQYEHAPVKKSCPLLFVLSQHTCPHLQV